MVMFYALGFRFESHLDNFDFVFSFDFPLGLG